MNSTVKRLAAVVAVGTVGLLAPVAGANAATTPRALPGFVLPGLASMPGLPAFDPAGLAFVGPSVGGLAAVIGPTVITVGAGNIFTNTNITTAGGPVGVTGP
ncbi:MAG: hypothetical protein QOE86_886 [Solirubrobacteraceae bacterium]|jgi:hypothetical protein|nr:hypothetical protein [Solirubrobacteraceae bacterium]